MYNRIVVAFLSSGNSFGQFWTETRLLTFFCKYVVYWVREDVFLGFDKRQKDLKGQIGVKQLTK